MSDQAVPATPSVPAIQARLASVSQQLRDSPSIDPESRQALGELIEELATALRSGEVAPTEAAELTEIAAHLAEALQHRHDPGRRARVRDRVEQAVLAAEAEAPLVSGLAHRLLETLTNLGI